jgi:hypothetical protein
MFDWQGSILDTKELMEYADQYEKNKQLIFPPILEITLEEGLLEEGLLGETNDMLTLVLIRSEKIENKSSHVRYNVEYLKTLLG